MNAVSRDGFRRGGTGFRETFRLGGPEIKGLEDTKRPFAKVSGTTWDVYLYVLTAREPVGVSVRNVSLDGDYFNSRMIGNYVYAVISRPVYWLMNEVPLPQIQFRNLTEEVPATQVYHLNISDSYYTFTTIMAVNTQNDTEDPTHKTFLLPTGGMYVSQSNIYITYSAGKTFIYRIQIEGGEIECVAKGEVPGRVLNQFAMDEYGDYFRVATTTSSNNVYVLDMNLTIVGSLEDLAPGESIYSARFMGDRCYLVTFRRVDPLYVINLTDPRNPDVLGYLKIPGYSSYLHPYDEDHLIGIGRENGVKISLFDVSNVSKPREIAKYEIGSWETDSPVLTDHKALLFDKTRDLLVIPIRTPVLLKDGDHYTHCLRQDAYIFHISLEDGLTLRDTITHLNAIDPTENDYYSCLRYFVKRSLYIDDVLYTVSDRKIKMNSLADLHELNEVELP